MKTLIFALLILPIGVNSQELSLNEKTSAYDYSKIIEINENRSDVKDDILKNLRDLNYQNVIVETETISADSFYSKLIITTPVNINYHVTIDFKDNKYRLLINRFVLDDGMRAVIPLENLKAHTKRWVKDINKNLPSIIKAIESPIEKW